MVYTKIFQRIKGQSMHIITTISQTSCHFFSLAPTKRRLIVKSGGVFTSPIFYYEEIKSVKKSTQRYTSKVYSKIGTNNLKVELK